MEGAGDLLNSLDEFRDELDDELLAIADENLADSDICELAGVERIEDVRSLALVVKTTDGNSVLGDLGLRVPTLTRLKLSGSSIASIRDLGTSWPNLDVLWLARCGLCDLDGLHGLSMLSELYLAFNDVVDLSGFTALERLTVLDLEANKVVDLGQIEFLKQCVELTDLTLQHNPIAQHADYRQTVCAQLAQLCTLDERKVTSAERATGGASDSPPARSAPLRGTPAHAAERGEPGVAGEGACPSAVEVDPLEQMRRELQLVMDGVKYAQVEGLSASLGSSASPMRRPGTALSSRPTTAGASLSGRPSSGGSPGSLSRPRTSWRAPSAGSALERGSSAPMSELAPPTGARSSPATPLGSTRPGLARPGTAAASRAVGMARPGSARPGSARPGSARPGSAGRWPPSGSAARPPAGPTSGRAPGSHPQPAEDNGSKLTMGTQSVFCGTGIRALRAHKLRNDDEDAAAAAAAAEPLLSARTEQPLSMGGSVLNAQPSSRASSAGGSTRATTAAAEGSRETLAQAEKQQWSREYTEIMQQLRAVKLEEAWEGRDAFASMEMGLDEDETAHLDPRLAAVQPVLSGRAGGASGSGAGGEVARSGSAVRRRLPRQSGSSGGGGADILTLDDDGNAISEPGVGQWSGRANLREPRAMVTGR